MGGGSRRKGWAEVPVADTPNLLKYLIAETGDRDLPLLKTALVKLLYLADVEAVRRGLPRLSSVSWLYYKYGPYAFEIEDVLKQLAGSAIDEMERVSQTGRKYQTYRIGEPISSLLSPEEKALLNFVIERWAGESLEKLLNYVYFETEPMLAAEWGEPLDFSMIPQREEHVDVKDIVVRGGGQEAVGRLRKFKEQFWRVQEAGRGQRVRPSPPPRYDGVFQQALKAMDEDDLKGFES